MSFCRQQAKFDFPEFERMALGLQGDGAPIEQFPAVRDQPPGVRILLVELRPAVFEHQLAIDGVSNEPAAVNFHLGGDPLVAVKGG